MSKSRRLRPHALPLSAPVPWTRSLSWLWLGLVACDASAAHTRPSSARADATVSAADAAAVSGEAAGELDAAAPGAAPPELEHIAIEVHGLTFSALAAGPQTGELVLLLHGFPESSYEWRYALAALGKAGYRAIAPDQRGYASGARPSQVEDYALRNLLSDVVGMADALGVQRFHVVGHDWGAVVAWVAAAFAPKRVASLAAISTAHPQLIAEQRAQPESCQALASAYFAQRKQPDAAAQLLRDDAALLRAELAGLPEDAVEHYLAVLGEEPALNAALNWYRANIDPAEPAIAVGTIDAPTLYVWGDQDATNCEDVAEATAGYVSGPYRFERIHAGHYLPEREPDQVGRLLLEHLERNRDR